MSTPSAVATPASGALSAARPASLQLVAVFAFLLAEVLLLQWLGGAFSSGFGGHPDEAAHYVSSLMLRDFLPQAGAGHPMQFAQSYYLHYPKVAIGNWPPLMYAVAGVWFLLFGASRLSAMAFIATCASVTAFAIYAIGRKLLTWQAGLFAAALYLACPLVQESHAMMMSEAMVTMLILLATLQFARFADTRKTLDALLFGMLASAAILTRGSAWALIFVPLFTIPLLRAWRLLLDWRLWLGALPVALSCVPWYLYARGMSNGAMVGIDPNAPFAFFIQALKSFPSFLWQATGPLLSLMFVLGAVFLARRQARFPAYWAALLSILAGIVLLQSIVPASIEQRFMVQVLPAFLLVATAGVHWLLQRLPHQHVPAAWAGAAALAMLTMFSIPSDIRNSGYGDVSAAMLHSVQGQRDPALLLSSDPIGEGSVVAAIAGARTAENPVCLRASKILVSEDWLGRNSTPRYGSIDELRTLLDKVPVRAVMIDEAIVKTWQRGYHNDLAMLVRSDSANWRLAGTYPVQRNGETSQGRVSVYVRQTTGAPGATDMNMVARLMRNE